jgi:hypothetical protein
MVFNTTFNNISVISWWSVLLVVETAVPREKQRPFNMVKIKTIYLQGSFNPDQYIHIQMYDKNPKQMYHGIGGGGVRPII